MRPLRPCRGGAAVTDLEESVLEYVEVNGPASGKVVAAQIRRRKQDVLKALRALESQGVVRRTRDGFERFPGGSTPRSHMSPPRSSRSEVIAGEFAALQRLLERRRPA
jgi:hypothetical protein